MTDTRTYEQNVLDAAEELRQQMRRDDAWLIGSDGAHAAVMNLLRKAETLICFRQPGDAR